MQDVANKEMRSEVIEQVLRQRKALDHFIQLLLLPLVVKGYHLHSLEHVAPVKRHHLSLCEILLKNVDKGFEDHLLDVVVAVFFVDSVKMCMQLRVGMFFNNSLLFYLFAGDSVVLLPVAFGLHHSQ